jgi:hypothetical protein
MTTETDAYLKFLYTEDVYIFKEDLRNTSQNPSDIHADKDQNISTDGVSEPYIVKYIGSNNKGVLILVHDSQNEFLNKKDYDFLMRIIEGGLKFSKTDIAIVNCHQFEYDQIFDEIDHQYLIAFGNHTASFAGTNPMYQVYKYLGKKVLLADSLNEIEPSIDKKTLLWKALQLMFDIK